jgi:hypothetical protein
MNPCWGISHKAPPPVIINHGELRLRYHSELDMVIVQLCLDVESKSYHVWKLYKQRYIIKYNLICNLFTCLLRHTRVEASEERMSWLWSFFNNGNIKYLVGDKVEINRTPGIFLRSEKLSSIPLTTPDTRTVMVVSTDELRRSGIRYPIAVAINCRELIWIAMFTLKI